MYVLKILITNLAIIPMTPFWDICRLTTSKFSVVVLTVDRLSFHSSIPLWFPVMHDIVSHGDFKTFASCRQTCHEFIFFVIHDKLLACKTRKLEKGMDLSHETQTFIKIFLQWFQDLSDISILLSTCLEVPFLQLCCGDGNFRNNRLTTMPTDWGLLITRKSM